MAPFTGARGLIRSPHLAAVQRPRQPPRLPGAAVASGASAWTLAHEIGDVLGLSQVDDNNRPMTGNGTDNITNPPPDIVASESATMPASPSTT